MSTVELISAGMLIGAGWQLGSAAAVLAIHIALRIFKGAVT